MIVDELVAILGYEVEGQEKLRSFTQSIDDVAKRLVTFAAAAATAAAGASALLAKSVIETTAKFESFQATLETVEGSAEKARASLDWISDFAKKTPFEVEELTAAFVKLRAYGMDPTSGLLEDLGNASSAMGKSLMDAVEMIADASTGEFERLKEFGIRASQAGKQVTFSWTENGKTLTKTVNKTSDEITKFLRDRFGARFSGAMMRQSKTWNGMMSNLSDSWTDFQRRIGEAGFFDAVKNQLGRAMDFIGRLDADGSLDRWATNISRAFTYVSNVIGGFATQMARNLGTIGEIIDRNKAAWDWLKWVLAAIALRMFPLTFALGVAAAALDDFLTYMRGGKSVIGDFIDAIAKFLGAEPQTVADVLGAMAKGAGGLAAAAIGVAAFAGSLKKLATAVGLFAGGEAAAGASPLLRLLGVAGAAAGGAMALGSQVKSGQTFYQQGKSLIPGPEDALSWLYGAFVGRPEGHPYTRKAGAPVGYEGTSLRPGQSNPDLQQLLRNLDAHQAKMDAGSAASQVQNTLNDSSNRSVTVNTSITQNVQQATQAPGAAASATAGAVNSAIQSQAPAAPPARMTGGGGGF